MKRLVYVLVAMLLVSVGANAQLDYSGGVLTFGDMPSTRPSNYSTAWVGNSHYWINGNTATNEDGTPWLRIDVTGIKSVQNQSYGKDAACISGSTGKVCFYGGSTYGTAVTSYGYQDIYVQTVYCYSDSRAKQNVVNLSNSTSKIMNMRPVSYEFKNRNESKGRKTNRDVGFLAQELQTVLPEAVVTTEDGEMLVNYMAVIPLLTNAIQELNVRIEELEAELKSVKN